MIVDLSYLHRQLNSLNNEISYILKRTGFDYYSNMDNVEFEKNNPDALFLKDEFIQIMYHLDEVKSKLDYLNKRIIGEYILHKNDYEQYECDEQIFRCGQSIEYYWYDNENRCFKWIISRVEHDGNDYYIVGDRSCSLNGLKVRIRR